MCACSLLEKPENDISAVCTSQQCLVVAVARKQQCLLNLKMLLLMEAVFDLEILSRKTQVSLK